VGGGFELELAPSRISLMAIYRAIDGVPDPSAALCSCCAQCPFRDCIFDTVLEDSARRFLDYLSGTTLDTVFLKLDKRECPSPRRKGRVLEGQKEQSGGEAYDAV
ncbi:MAG: Rrf2 family transcriptional regulator, partial [Fretibacterium sp.]